MAFGKGSRSFGDNAQLYSFKIKTKDLPAPIFEVSKKVGDKYEVQKETANRVSGNLIGARPKKNTHEGKEIKSVSLTLQDGDDVYFLDVGYTFLGRNLYNGLLNLNTFDDIEIGLYQSKPKPDAVDKRGFPSVALRQHGELIKGKFDNKTELPKTKKVRVNGKDQTDTEELDLFFEAKIADWCKLVNAASAASSKTQSTSSSTSHETDTSSEHTSEEDDPNAPPF